MKDCDFSRVHMIGIGGAGMSAIAHILLKMGKQVSGSDIVNSEYAKRLQEMGAKVYIGHRPENVDSPDIVVRSSAISEDNPEVTEAKKKGLPLLNRMELFGTIVEGKKLIAITGTHGKTTTTSMTSLLLKGAGMDPTVLIGGELNDIGGNALFGRDEYVVGEVDESDGNFVILSPYILVITNIEADHLEHYGGSMERLYEAFISVSRKAASSGYVVICGEHPSCKVIESVLLDKTQKVFKYGFGDGMDAVAKHVRLHGMGSNYEFFWQGEKVADVSLSVPGIHNVLNSLASLSVAMLMGLDIDEALKLLSGFQGVHRRFEVIGEANGVIVVDDYAHHPTEIAATIKAARGVWPDRRLVVLFQPHRYTRTKFFYTEFAKVLSSVDLAIITDIYSAGEIAIDGVSSMLIIDNMKKLGYTTVKYVQRSRVLGELPSMVKKGDVFFTVGAGDVCDVGKDFLKKLMKLQEGTDEI